MKYEKFRIQNFTRVNPDSMPREVAIGLLTSTLPMPNRMRKVYNAALEVTLAHDNFPTPFRHKLVRRLAAKKFVQLVKLSRRHKRRGLRLWDKIQDFEARHEKEATALREILNVVDLHATCVAAEISNRKKS